MLILAPHLPLWDVTDLDDMQIVIIRSIADSFHLQLGI